MLHKFADIMVSKYMYKKYIYTYIYRNIYYIKKSKDLLAKYDQDNKERSWKIPKLFARKKSEKQHMDMSNAKFSWRWKAKAGWVYKKILQEEKKHFIVNSIVHNMKRI